jgi:hypothetical protein
MDRVAKSVNLPPEGECSSQLISQKVSGKSPSIQMILADDPEVKEKLKELELARIERQIAEAKGELINSRAFERHVSTFLSLLENLFENGHISELAFETLGSECPWCGECEMVYEEIGTDHFRWRCRKCGKIVS